MKNGIIFLKYYGGEIVRLAYLSTWEKFEPCEKYRVFASNFNTFRKWRVDERLLIFIGKEGLVKTLVTGEFFNSNEMIWKNDLYEWRVPINKSEKFDGINGTRLNLAIKSLLYKEYGHYYGFLLRNHTCLREEVAYKIESILSEQPV